MPGVGSQHKINIYEVSSTGLHLIDELQLDIYSRADWVPGSDHQLYLLKGYESPISDNTENRFSIYNAATMSNEYDIPVKIGHFAGIDFTKKQVAFWDQIPNNDRKQKMYIYDLETGFIEKTIPLTPDINELYFWNSYVFSSEGFTINISNY
jgi:hypothetical protein